MILCASKRSQYRPGNHAQIHAASAGLTHEALFIMSIKLASLKLLKEFHCIMHQVRPALATLLAEPHVHGLGCGIFSRFFATTFSMQPYRFAIISNRT